MKLDVSIALLADFKLYLEDNLRNAKNQEESVRTQCVAYDKFDEQKQKVIESVTKVNNIEQRIKEVSMLIDQAKQSMTLYSEQTTEDNGDAYARLHEDSE